MNSVSSGSPASLRPRSKSRNAASRMRWSSSLLRPHERGFGLDESREVIGRMPRYWKPYGGMIHLRCTSATSSACCNVRRARHVVQREPRPMNAVSSMAEGHQPRFSTNAASWRSNHRGRPLRFRGLRAHVFIGFFVRHRAPLQTPSFIEKASAIARSHAGPG